MTADMLRVSAEDVETFQRDGVVIVRAAFEQHWVARLRLGVDRLRSAARQTEPSFFIDQYRWRDDPDSRASSATHQPPASPVA